MFTHPPVNNGLPNRTLTHPTQPAPPLTSRPVMQIFCTFSRKLFAYIVYVSYICPRQTKQKP